MTAIPVPAERHRQEVSILSDAELVPLARVGDEPAIRAIIQRHNRRLFRTARAIIRNDAEAEDVVQAAYIKAFTNLAAFRGDAQFSTWLTRIALNEALGRVRRQKNTTGLEEIDMQNEVGRRRIAISVLPVGDRSGNRTRQEPGATSPRKCCRRTAG